MVNQMASFRKSNAVAEYLAAEQELVKIDAALSAVLKGKSILHFDRYLNQFLQLVERLNKREKVPEGLEHFHQALEGRVKKVADKVELLASKGYFSEGVKGKTVDPISKRVATTIIPVAALGKRTVDKWGWRNVALAGVGTAVVLKIGSSVIDVASIWNFVSDTITQIHKAWNASPKVINTAAEAVKGALDAGKNLARGATYVAAAIGTPDASATQVANQSQTTTMNLLGQFLVFNQLSSFLFNAGDAIVGVGTGKGFLKTGLTLGALGLSVGCDKQPELCKKVADAVIPSSIEFVREQPANMAAGVLILQGGKGLVNQWRRGAPPKPISLEKQGAQLTQQLNELVTGANNAQVNNAPLNLNVNNQRVVQANLNQQGSAIVDQFNVDMLQYNERMRQFQQGQLFSNGFVNLGLTVQSFPLTYDYITNQNFANTTGAEIKQEWNEHPWTTSVNTLLPVAAVGYQVAKLSGIWTASGVAQVALWQKIAYVITTVAACAFTTTATIITGYYGFMV